MLRPARSMSMSVGPPKGQQHIWLSEPSAPAVAASLAPHASGCFAKRDAQAARLRYFAARTKINARLAAVSALMCSLSCRNFAPALGLVPWVSEISGTQGWIGLWVPALGLTPSAGMTMRRWSLRIRSVRICSRGLRREFRGGMRAGDDRRDAWSLRAQALARWQDAGREGVSP